MTQQLTTKLDFDPRAEQYARFRRVYPEVLAELLHHGELGPQSRVLDVGCGTGNYAAALHQATSCRVYGVDPSANMLAHARQATAWDALLKGRAEQLPFADDAFDLVMTTDVIHHIADRDAYFREAARLLRPGGRIVTVTDSHEDIPRRRPLSSYFPETVAVELRRYPPVPQLLAEMAAAGFTDAEVVGVTRQYALADIQAYRNRAFSSLLLIDDEAFARGIARMERDLARGPIPCQSRYTAIWGRVPPSASSRAREEI
jgi:ubiquinone/menaquinone biosynthesis C-methylase UbiE